MYSIVARGRFGLFTRPEAKVDRVSYEVITPSAARAVCESIFWKPAITIQIKRIQVLNPIEWHNEKTNELKDIQCPGTASAAAKTNGVIREDKRTQRGNRMLLNPKYKIDFDFKLRNPENKSTNECHAKYHAIIKQRLASGYTFRQPYFGLKCFICFIKEFNGTIESHPSLMGRRDLGYMVYDYDYDRDNTKTKWFNAVMVDGIIEIPNADSCEVLM